MDDTEKALRVIAELISDFRLEVLEHTKRQFERELDDVEKIGFDPARGRGRGPKWVDGA